MLAYWTDKDGQTRAKQRWKYFEPDEYRQLSEVLGPYEYSCWTEIYMLIHYLKNRKVPCGSDLIATLRKEIEENKTILISIGTTFLIILMNEITLKQHINTK